MNDQSTSVLVRMPAKLKAALQREAFGHRRSVTAEIVLRLEESLARNTVRYQAAASHIRPASASESGMENGLELSAMEHAMLDVFNQLPPEKQLALLSLFK